MSAAAEGAVHENAARLGGQAIQHFGKHYGNVYGRGNGHGFILRPPGGKRKGTNPGR